MKKRVIILTYILLSCMLFVSCGLKGKLATAIFTDVAIDLSYKKTESFHDGDFLFTKYYYSSQNIYRYQNKESEFLVVSNDTVEYIKHMIKCFEYSYSRACQESPESFTYEIKNNYDFDILNDIKEGDLFFFDFDTANDFASTYVIPENQMFQYVQILYVSFEKAIAYHFMDNRSFIYLFDNSEDELRKLRRYYKSRDELQDAKCGQFDDQTASLDYYYELRDNTLTIAEFCEETESIDAVYYVAGDNPPIMAAIGYIKSDDRKWSEDEFFLHYALFFGNLPKSYFYKNGTRYMKIETRYYTYYFFVYDGDYIIELWNTSSSGEKTDEDNLLVRKVIIGC